MKERDVVLLCLGLAIVAWLILRRGGSAAVPAGNGDVQISFPQAETGTSPDYLTYNMPDLSGGLPLVAPLAAAAPSSSTSPASKKKSDCGCGCGNDKGTRFASSVNNVSIPDSVTNGTYLANMASAFPNTVAAGGGSGVMTPQPVLQPVLKSTPAPIVTGTPARAVGLSRL